MPSPLARAAALALLLPLIALAAASGQEGKVVRSVEFEGLKQAGAAYLKEKLRTKEGDPFSRETLAQDLASLHRSGQFSGEITVDLEEGPTGVRVVFHLTERETVVRIGFEGRSELSEGDLTEGMHTRANELMNPFLVALDRGEIEKKYREKGYLFAEVKTDVRPVAGGVEVVFKVDEGRVVRFEKIRFTGNERYGSDELEKLIESKEQFFFGFITPGLFKRDVLEKDIDNVQKFYRGKGYLDAKAVIEDLSFNPERDRASVTIRVVEGPRYYLNAIRMRGNKLFTREEILEQMLLKEGGPFLGEELQPDMNRISRMYGEKAYIFEKTGFDLRYLEEPYKIDLTLDVQEGERITVEKIEFRGNLKTKDKVIRRELLFYPGEPFNTALVEESYNRLWRKQYFENIDLRFEDASEPDRRNVVLELQEGRTGQLLFGAGLSSTVGIFGNIVFQQRNFDILDVPTSVDDFLAGTAFVGAGQNFTIQAQPGKDRSRYRVSFTEPYVLDYPVSFSTGFFLFDRARGNWAEGRIGGNVAFGYRVGRDDVVELGYRLERVRVYDVDLFAIDDIVAVAGDNYVAGVKLGYHLNRNRVDRYFVAYGGYAFSAEYEIATTGVGADFNWNRISAEANWQYLLFQWPGEWKHVFALRAASGWQEPFGGTGKIPIFERYFAGGPQSIRGFEFRSVGPQDRKEPLGGDFLVTGTAEYSFPIFRDILRGVLFLDAGTVEPRISDLDIEDIRVSTGLGFRVKVPVFPAPVQFDFGFPLKKRGGDDLQVFSFSLGFGF